MNKASGFRIYRLGIVALALAWLLTGCAGSATSIAPVAQDLPQVPAAPTINDALLHPAVELVGESQILQLSADQQAHFLAYFDHPERGETPRHEVTSDYLQDLLTRFDYHPDTTDAHSTRTHLRGNCMSLAILTTALAELAGVQVRYQLIEQTPVFDIRGGLMMTSVHVRTILVQNHHRYSAGQFVFGQSRLAIDFFPDANHRSGRRISRDDFLSMYFRNLSVEALLADNPQIAMGYAAKALALTPQREQAINLVGLLHSRMGDKAGAERFYRYGLNVASQTLELMNNYLGLLQRQGRAAEAQAMADQILALDEPSPFGWLRLAMIAQQKKQFVLAASYYEKCLRYAPELARAWQGLALSLARSASDDVERIVYAQQQAQQYFDEPGAGQSLAKKISILKRYGSDEF
ncbi:MAG: hypothetical protein AB8B96_12250 [Lysobacterales bacterium]